MTQATFNPLQTHKTGVTDMMKLYSCTLLPEVFRDIEDPPKFGGSDDEHGVVGAFWRKTDQRLFAASPDMLQALECVTPLLDDLLHGREYGDFNSAVRQLSKAREAIAKATAQ